MLALLLFALARGSAFNSYGLPLLLSSTVALQIQVSMGMPEFHFGVFVTLALVMVYRNWRVVLICALLFAVHHLLFDRLQAWGLGLYCLTAPSVSRVFLHAVFVVLQTVVEIFMIYRMSQAFAQGRELNALVQQVDGVEGIALDVRDAKLETAVAQRLLQTFLRMNETVTGVQHSLQVLEQACTSIGEGSEELSARTEQARHSVEETAAASTEIHETLASTAQQAREAHVLATEAVETARQADAKVHQLVEGMHSIEQGAAQISDIVSVVDSLAFQTNLLALNAAVEAARAGEQGRGFAVVADEVRRLALRSSDAAKGIRQQMEHSSGAVAQGVSLSAQVQQMIAECERHIETVSERVSDIAQATVQQHEGVTQISEAMAQIEQASAMNAMLAEQSLNTAQTLQQTTAQMRAQSAVFMGSRA